MKSNAIKLASYIGVRVHHMFDRFTKDLTEHRVLLNWLYAVAYLALVFFCAVTNKSSQNTAIVTTGSIVSAIFATYVLGSSYEKVAKMRLTSPASGASEAEGVASTTDEEKAGD